MGLTVLDVCIVEGDSVSSRLVVDAMLVMEADKRHQVHFRVDVISVFYGEL